MEVLHLKCASLDVHKDVVVACLRVVEDAKVRQDVRSFATTTSGLLELGEWLGNCGCTHVFRLPAQGHHHPRGRPVPHIQHLQPPRRPTHRHRQRAEQLVRPHVQRHREPPGVRRERAADPENWRAS